MPTETSDADLAVAAARAAGELLIGIRAELSDADPRGLAGIADKRSDELLLNVLTSARPDDAILSEESAGAGDRLGADRVWIIDPLDGTREYGESGRDDWAVHVALWQSGELIEGAVAIPDAGEVWSTQAAAAGPVSRPVRRIAVSRTRPPRWAELVAAEIGAELVPMGSAGAKVAAVLRGDVDAYFHDGGQFEWDSAAPVVVARRYGYAATRADGSELRYNRPDPFLPDLIVCPSAQADDILARIAMHRVPVPAKRPLG